MIAEFIALTALVTLILMVLGGTLWTGVPPMPTNRPTWRVMERLLPGAVEGEIIEMGAGWGGVALKLARRYPENRVIAVELSPLPCLIAWCRAKGRTANNLTIRWGSVQKMDVSRAGLATIYLFPSAMARLGEKFLAELPEGALILSNTFSLPGWNPVKRIRAADIHRSPVYLYRKGQGQGQGQGQ